MGRISKMYRGLPRWAQIAVVLVVVGLSVLRVVRLLVLFIAAGWCLVRVYREPRVRQRLVAYWWAWLPIAVIAVIGNEVFDRVVANESHPLGDLVLAVDIVGIVFYGSGVVARRRSRLPG